MNRTAAINVKVLTITLLVLVLLGGGAVVGHQIRQRHLASAALAKGRAAYEREDYETARGQLGRYLSRNPQDLETLRQYARAQRLATPFRIENIRQAISAYRQILRMRPDDEQAYRELVQLYRATRDYAELEYVSDERWKLVQDYAAKVTYAQALIGLRKPEDARQALESVVSTLEAAPGGPHAALVDAYLLLSALEDPQRDRSTPGGNWEAAVQWLDRAIEHDPQSAAARVQRANVLRRQAATELDREAARLHAAARADLEATEALANLGLQARLMLCDEWIEHDGFDPARAHIELLAAAAPDTIFEIVVDADDWKMAVFERRVGLAIATRAYAEACAAAEAILGELKQPRHRLDALARAVEALARDRRIADARTRLDEYVELSKGTRSVDHPPERVAFLQAIVAALENRPYDVIRLLQPYGRRANMPAALRRLLVDALVQTGQTARAAPLLRASADQDPGDRETARALARASLILGDAKRALELSRRLEAADPADFDARILRIQAELLSLRPGDAARLDALDRELTESVSAHPQRSDLRMMRATLAETRSQLEAAEQILREAVDATVDSPGPSLQLARLYIRDRRMDDADAVLRAACEKFPALATPWLALAELQPMRRQPDAVQDVFAAGLAKVTDPRQRRRLEISAALADYRTGRRAEAVARLKALLSPKDAPAGVARDPAVLAALLELPEVLADRATASEYVAELKANEGEDGLRWPVAQARILLSAPDWKKDETQAEELLRRAIAGDPRAAAPVLLLGRLYELQGREAVAEAVYNAALSVAPRIEVGERLINLLQRRAADAEIPEVFERLKRRVDERRLLPIQAAVAVQSGDTAGLSAVIEDLSTLVETQDPDAPRESGGLLYLARLAYLNRDPKKAFAYVEEAERASPNSLEVARWRAVLLLGENRADEAIGALDAAVAADPGSFEARATRGYFLQRIGKLEEAEKDFAALTTLPGAEIRGPTYLGEFYAQTGRLGDAIRIWTQALEKDPGNTQLQRGIVKALLMRGQGDDRARAGTLLAELERRFPNDLDLIRVRAAYEVGGGGEIDRARLRDALKSPPGDTEAVLALIRVAFSLEEYDVARELALRGLQSSPANVELLVARARAELQLGILASERREPRPEYFDSAREQARAILNREARNVDALAILAEVARRREDTAEVRRIFELCLAGIEDDSTAEALQVLAARLAGHLNEQVDESIQRLEAFRKTPEGARSIDVLLTLSDLSRRRGDWTSAERALDIAAEVAPQNPTVAHARLMLLAAQRKWAEVTALLLQPGDAGMSPVIMKRGAAILAGSGDRENLPRARQVYERILATAPTDVDGMLGLAIIAYQGGDRETAMRMYRDVLRQDESQVIALNNLAWLLAEKDPKDPQALELARKAVAIAPNNPEYHDTLGVILMRLEGKLSDARDELRKAYDLTPAGSPARARAALQLARVSEEFGDRRGIRAVLEEATAIDKARPVFSPEERVEIQKLLEGTEQQPALRE
jgi:tetratricopeptide (TPR) repeat protein